MLRRLVMVAALVLVGCGDLEVGGDADEDAERPACTCMGQIQTGDQALVRRLGELRAELLDELVRVDAELGEHEGRLEALEAVGP